jgi:2-polyprenyl-3-methyl-5-hydroxy-6-metoxy-1,4-benzoquinol methylase
MSLQMVKDEWIYLDGDAGAWKGMQSAQGVFQPIHWVAMHRMQCVLRLAPHAGPIADIGCSYGVFSLNLAWKKPRVEVVGLDPDEKRLSVAQRLLVEHHLSNCRFQKGSVEEPAIPPNSCACVICTETLDHIAGIKPHLEQAVAGLLRLLMPGGRLILSIPALEEMAGQGTPPAPSPLNMGDFAFLSNLVEDHNCPRWWHLFYVDKI